MPLLGRGEAMRRRQFLTLLGGAATALPSYTALAQQQIPLVGFLNNASPDTYRFNADSFREGLARAGFVEGKNVRIEERWAVGTMAHCRHLRPNWWPRVWSRLLPQGTSHPRGLRSK